jgi:hypothetical protein
LLRTRLPGVDGATGDGSTNDQAAIQRAITTALLTGDVLEFPVAHNATTGVPEAPFKYKIDTPLFIGGEKNLRLKGPGQIIVAPGVEGIIVNQNPSESQDIWLDGLNITGGTSPIVSRGPNRVRITNCVIEGFSVNGVFVDAVGIAHNTVVMNNNIHTTVNLTAVGVYVDSVDTVVIGNVIRGCSVGIYADAPALIIKDNHIFPDDNGPTNYSIQLGPNADHLVNIADNYLDNPKLAFVDVNAAAGGPQHTSPRSPRDYDPGGGEQIRIRGNIMLIKDHPLTVKWVIGGPANFFDNIFRDNS